MKENLPHTLIGMALIKLHGVTARIECVCMLLWSCNSISSISWLFNCSTWNGKVNKSDCSSISLFARLINVIVTVTGVCATLANLSNYRKLTTIISFVFKFYFSTLDAVWRKSRAHSFFPSLDKHFKWNEHYSLRVIVIGVFRCSWCFYHSFVAHDFWMFILELFHVPVFMIVLCCNYSHFGWLWYRYLCMLSHRHRWMQWNQIRGVSACQQHTSLAIVDDDNQNWDQPNSCKIF